MDFKTLILRFKTDRKVIRNVAGFRGFIARQFPDSVLLHQHNGEKFVYSYPLVQYKIINSSLMIVGIGDGIEALRRVYSEIGYVELEKNKHNILEKMAKEKKVIFGLTSFFNHYHFLTPWLSLNKSNYQKYQKMRNLTKKNEFLEKMIINNSISISKGLGYTVPAPIKAHIKNFKEVQTSLKGTPMLGFLGSFSVNFEIPDYWGIGKSVSRGFGTVKRIKGPKN